MKTNHLRKMHNFELYGCTHTFDHILHRVHDFWSYSVPGNHCHWIFSWEKILLKYKLLNTFSFKYVPFALSAAVD